MRVLIYRSRPLYFRTTRPLTPSPLVAAPSTIHFTKRDNKSRAVCVSEGLEESTQPADRSVDSARGDKDRRFREWCYIFQAAVARLFGFSSRFFPFPKFQTAVGPSDAIAERAGMHSRALNNQTKKLACRKCPWDTHRHPPSVKLAALPSPPILRIFRRSLMACHKTFITFGISTSGLLPVRSCESLRDAALLFLAFPLSKGTMGG